MPEINKDSDAYIVMLDASVIANESSDFFLRESWFLHSIQVTKATSDVTVKIYASNNGTQWAQVGSDITGNAIVQLAGLYKYLKVVRDNTTNGVTVTCYSGSKFRK